MYLFQALFKGEGFLEILSNKYRYLPQDEAAVDGWRFVLFIHTLDELPHPQINRGASFSRVYVHLSFTACIILCC